MARTNTNLQIVDMLRDEFKVVHAKLDHLDARFASHAQEDKIAWDKLDDVSREGHSLRYLLHAIWIGGSTIAGLVIAYFRL